MFTYFVHYDYQNDNDIWVYNQIYVTKFDSKSSHKLAARELEAYIGSFNNFRINKIICD